MTPAVTIAVTLVVLAVALTALFWGLSLVLQGYFYNAAADKLPLRALVAGIAVALFLTGWTYINTRASHKDKYGPLLAIDRMMTPETTAEVDGFEAVRRMAVKDEKGQPKEMTAQYKWQAEGGGGRFIEVGTNREFKLNDSTSMTVAIVVPEGEGKKARFDAVLENGAYPGGEKERRFEEQGGSRSLDGRSPRKMAVPSGSALAVGLALNALHFVVWFLVFWLALRFSAGHALMIVAVLGTMSMGLAMPLLFDLNTPKPALIQQQQEPAAK